MRGQDSMGVRRFGAVNWLGLWTLYAREVRRFSAVYTQTILAPLATSTLFMVVFTLAFADRRGDIEDTPFALFLAPGILMMTVIQNAFANTSSSIVISKVQGNIVDTLMPPLSAAEIVTGYVMGGVTRGLACALAIGLLIFPVLGLGLAEPLWAVAFALMGSLMLSLLGLLGGIYADKFDQMAALTNFLVTPLAFPSGTFYSVSVLPEPFLTLSHLNPVFYLIDGFRYGTLGQSDASPWLGLAVTGILNVALWALAHRWVARGYRLKS
jgi:ABC-2 type transport system permease protein